MTSVAAKHPEVSNAYRVVVLCILVCVGFSFCLPAISTPGVADDGWQSCPSMLQFLLNTLQEPTGILPVIFVLILNLLVVAALLLCLIPKHLHSAFVMTTFVVLTACFAMISSFFLAVIFALLFLGAWLPGPGACLWLGSVLAAFLAVGYGAVTHQSSETIFDRDEFAALKPQD